MRILVLFLLVSFSVLAGEKCAKEGASAGGSCVGCLTCCEGLVQTNSWLHQNISLGCKAPPPPGSGGRCIQCGDGKCDSSNFENYCNCPKDCKKG